MLSIEMQEGRGSRSDTGDYVWRKPMEGWIKVNTDAAVFQDGSIGVGCVIRDSYGKFVGAKCCRVAGAWSPRETEATDMKEALSWMLTRRNQQCIMETDCQVQWTTRRGHFWCNSQRLC